LGRQNAQFEPDKRREERNKMRPKVNQENGAVYFRLDDTAIVESEEIQPGVILDDDVQNRVVGVEILGIRERVPSEKLKSLPFGTV
jgi:uncharacterized protein YuzE